MYDDITLPQPYYQAGNSRCGHFKSPDYIDGYPEYPTLLKPPASECQLPGPVLPEAPSPEPLVRYEFIPGFLRVYIGDSVRVDFLQPPENIAPRAESP